MPTTTCPKPFRFEELLARVRLRMTTELLTELTVLFHGGLHLDLRTRRARVDDHTVDPSAREFALAETFLRHPGQVLSREQLVSHVRGYDFDPGSNVVDVYVRYLRRKTRHGPVCHAAWNGLPAGRSSLNTRRSSSSPTGSGELGWFHRNVLR